MKIKIHLITQIYLLLSLFAGFFYEVMTLYICLLVHEFGHYVMIKLFKKDIKLLEISPLGGILHIDKCQNDKNIKELLIYIGGPLASLLLYLTFKYLNVSELLIKSSLYILIFNLLPIIPLDGARILMCLKQYLLPYKKVLYISVYLSFLFIIGLIIYFNHYINYVIILSFFVFLTISFYQNISYTYFSFLWYKYLHPNKNLKKKFIFKDKGIYNLFYKGFNNIFYKNLEFIPESVVLRQILKHNE